MPTGRPFRYTTGTWSNSAVLTNPTDATVIVDTGALNRADLLIAVIGAGSVAYTYDVQYRNAANDANLSAQRRICLAGNDEFVFPSSLSVATNERIRVVLVGSITGTLQVSVFHCALL